MGKGRKPEPTRLKMIKGNPGKRPINEDEPKPRPVAPKRPAWMTGEAKKEWERLAPELERLGILTIVDGAAFAGLCYSYGQVVELIRDIKKNGRIHITPNGHKQARAEVSLVKDYLRLVRQFAADFGLTPADRSRIKGIGDQLPLFGSEDEIEQYMR